MSQSAPKPHTVKVYGITQSEGKDVLSVLGAFMFPSKCGADKFASEQRKLPNVTSASVYPTPTETAAA